MHQAPLRSSSTGRDDHERKSPTPSAEAYGTRRPGSHVLPVPKHGQQQPGDPRARGIGNGYQDETNDGHRDEHHQRKPGRAGGGQGGGIQNYGSLTIRNSTVTGNSAKFAGGIEMFAGTLTIEWSTIAFNTANQPGGGLDVNPAQSPHSGRSSPRTSRLLRASRTVTTRSHQTGTTWRRAPVADLPESVM